MAAMSMLLLFTSLTSAKQLLPRRNWNRIWIWTFVVDMVLLDGKTRNDPPARKQQPHDWQCKIRHVVWCWISQQARPGGCVQHSFGKQANKLEVVARAGDKLTTRDMLIVNISNCGGTWTKAAVVACILRPEEGNGDFQYIVTYIVVGLLVYKISSTILDFGQCCFELASS